jgi:iron(III) transport system substrate-binding protein
MRKMGHTSLFFLAVSTIAASMVSNLSYAQNAPSAAVNTAKELNLYSSRHYQTDEKLYSKFTELTGIKINRLDADDNGILERVKNEGTSSPADVIVLTDASRLWKAEANDLFMPVQSKILNEKIPQQFKSKNYGNGNKWFGFSIRARVIVYNKANTKPTDVDTYEKLAQPINKGKLCTRSASHPYMLSLLSSIIEEKGEAAATLWAQNMAANLAKPPKGGDTDQIKAVASGECGVALSNSYYYARLMSSTKPEDQAVIAKTGLIWPNQANNGAHINISGGGVAKNAPHAAYAVQFLEYLASQDAQAYFANGNNEWPVVANVKIDNKALQTLGKFKQQKLNAYVIGMNQVKAQKILDKVGYK